MTYSERTFLFPLELAGVGTVDVEGLHSYIERLAFEHGVKPRALLETLTARYPLGGKKLTLVTLLKTWDVHGFSLVSRKLRDSLEHATGISLRSSTLHRFNHLFPCMHLTRAGGLVHCPECVKENDGIGHGQLLWDVCGVNACARHGLRLRSSEACGAPASERLRVMQRPALRTVCSGCGALGFSCIASPTEAATEAEVWVANQVGSLLTLRDDEIAALTKESMLRGLQALVREAFGGTVGASKRCRMSKGSLSMWVRGLGAISLGALLQLCSFARVDVLKVMSGDVTADDCAGNHGTAGALILSRKQKKQAKLVLSDEDARQALMAAASQAEPPSFTRTMNEMGMDRRVAQRRFPQECKALADARVKWLETIYQQARRSVEQTYIAAATELAQQGKKVTSKSLQRQAGLVAFSQNAPRVEVLRSVVARFTPSRACEEAPA